MTGKAAIRQVQVENESLSHVLSSMRAVLDWPAEDGEARRKISSTHFSGRSFQHHLERLIEIKEYEAFQEIREERPELAGAIDRLRGQYEGCRQRMREIMPRLECLASQDFDALEETCNDLRELARKLEALLREENRLIFDAFFQDVGGGD